MFLEIPFRPLFQARTYRDLLFIAAAFPLAAIVLAVVLAGWIAVAVLAITPLVVPVLVGYRGAIGHLARADAGLSRSLLDVTAEPPISSGGQWFWGRAKAVLVEITDDGVGIDWNAPAGVGLRSMRERAAELGGDLVISSGRAGTTIRATIPRRTPARDVARV